jgi:hypothetical protein
MTDTKNAKAWPRVFADRKGLAGTLLSVWEGASPVGMTGGHLRDLYAGCLDEAAGLLGVDALRGPAERFRAAARAWERVAAVALRDDHPYLARLRELTAQVRAAVADPASTDQAEVDQAAADLWKLREFLDRELDKTLDEAEAAGLFQQLGAAVGDVYARESEAVAALSAIPL